LVATGLLLFAVLLPSTVAAGPPVTLRGIELPTVLSFYDRARHVAHRADQQADPREQTDHPDEPPQKRLESIDTIVLDPGHGAGNSGAIGVAHVAEKYLTLELAYALRRRIQETYPDVRVVLTRYWDKGLSLDERTHLANRIDADLFLSLHYNAAVHQRAVGYETYYLATREAIPGRQQVKGEPIAAASSRVTGIAGESDEEAFEIQGDDLAVIKRDLARARQHRFSGLLAETVQRHLIEHVDSVDRGVKQANFGVLRGALMPAVVVESGFLTHPDEGRQVLDPDHRKKLVESLMESIDQFDALQTRALK
jgi:N-acetylmuramoyl-L-alanine amidase